MTGREFMDCVLVTGGSGFIGSHLCEHLQRDGFSVVVPSHQELDVCIKSGWAKYRNQGIGHVVHLAGKVFVPASWECPETFFSTNYIGTLNALEFCRRTGAGMTYLSSYVYGVPKRNPIKESDAVRPNNPYACAKYLGEELCRYYCELFSMNVTVLRPFNVYGQGQAEHFLIPHIIRQAAGTEAEITLQDLAPKRDYVYINDVCRAIESSIMNTRSFHMFNVGFGKSYSVEEVVNTIQNLLGTDKKVTSKNVVRKNELDDVVADISKIREEWGWTPTFDLESGLSQYIGSVQKDLLVGGK